jgi:hypothetical protein
MQKKENWQPSIKIHKRFFLAVIIKTILRGAGVIFEFMPIRILKIDGQAVFFVPPSACKNNSSGFYKPYFQLSKKLF